MRYKEITEDRGGLSIETPTMRRKRLRAFAASKGYDIQGNGITPEQTVAMLNESSKSEMVVTKNNKHRIRAWLDDEDDGK